MQNINVLLVMVGLYSITTSLAIATFGVTVTQENNTSQAQDQTEIVILGT